RKATSKRKSTVVGLISGRASQLKCPKRAWVACACPTSTVDRVNTKANSHPLVIVFMLLSVYTFDLDLNLNLAGTARYQPFRRQVLLHGQTNSRWHENDTIDHCVRYRAMSH